jgi:hypothetical protein
MYGAVEVYFHHSLRRHYMDAEWSASRSGRFTPGEIAPCTHQVGPRASVDAVE